jgi:uncharacterized Tic20 family protein
VDLLQLTASFFTKGCEMDQTYEATQDERLMAAVAHVTILFPFMGIVAPVLLWATQKDQSEFLAFQALQAAVYQICLLILGFIGFGCYFLTIFVSIGGTLIGMFSAPLLALGSDDPESLVAVLALLLSALPTFIPFLLFGVFVLVALFLVVYGVIGAVAVFQGKDFRYVVIGKRIEAYLHS